jgi:hypothetical protein
MHYISKFRMTTAAESSANCRCSTQFACRSAATAADPLEKTEGFRRLRRELREKTAGFRHFQADEADGM